MPKFLKIDLEVAVLKLMHCMSTVIHSSLSKWNMMKLQHLSLTISLFSFLFLYQICVIAPLKEDSKHFSYRIWGILRRQLRVIRFLRHFQLIGSQIHIEINQQFEICKIFMLPWFELNPKTKVKHFAKEYS